MMGALVFLLLAGVNGSQDAMAALRLTLTIPTHTLSSPPFAEIGTGFICCNPHLQTRSGDPKMPAITIPKQDLKYSVVFHGPVWSGKSAIVSRLQHLSPDQHEKVGGGMRHDRLHADRTSFTTSSRIAPDCFIIDNFPDEPRFDAVDSPGFVAGVDVATHRAVIAEMGATLSALRWPWRRLYYVVTAYNERSAIVAQLTALSHGYGVNVAKQVRFIVNKSDKLSADSVEVLKAWLREAYALVFGGPQIADDSIIFVAGDGETPCLYQLYEDLISAASAEDLHPSAGAAPATNYSRMAVAVELALKLAPDPIHDQNAVESSVRRIARSAVSALLPSIIATALL